MKLDTATKKDKPMSKAGKKSAFKKISLRLVKAIAVLLPLGIIAALIPYGIVQSSSILEPFFASTNFTITDSTDAFSTLKKEPELRQDGKGFTNILIVGVDTRPGRSRLLNTDTIILASYNHKTNEVSMLSFPRDLNVQYPGTPSIGKINATYAYGELRKEGTGMEYLRQLIENISGQKIQYHMMVDLQGFITVVDTLGGIDVYVDTAFSGNYPSLGGGWVTPSFKQGLQHMDGSKALQYARIRYAYPYSEASDFARARRQQKVIAAVVEKATKVESLQNTKAILEILKKVSKNIRINRITPDDISAGLHILLTKGKPTTYSMVLDPAAGGSYGRLVVRGPGHLYTLEPALGNNNWTDIKGFIKDYVAVPKLVTMERSVYVYNKGVSNYSTLFSNISKRYYYATFVNGGTPKVLPEKGVYYTGGDKFIPMCEYFATKYQTNCINPEESEIAVPKPNDAGVVIVLQD